jgi:DNA-3-methyladenine glycosylase
MFGEPGRWYVFFNYGVHWMLNAVTGERGHAAAVLLRGVDGVIGPGRLTRKFGVDKTLYGKAIAPASGLWIEDRGIRVPRRVLRRSPRIGIDYAGPVWAKKPYRFHIDKRYLTSAAWKDKITSMTGSHLIVNTEKKSKKPSGEG